MSEIKKQVTPIMINYRCDDCEKIPNTECILQNNGKMILIYPSLYGYECPNCKKQYEFDKHYPYIDFI